MVPIVVLLFTTTLAPIIDSPFASTTVPFTTELCMTEATALIGVAGIAQPSGHPMNKDAATASKTLLEKTCFLSFFMEHNFKFNNRVI